MKKLLLPLITALLPLAAHAEIRINEVHFNVSGPDTNYEFIELKSTTNGAEPLTGLSLVIINSARSDDGQYLNPGQILEVWNLNDLSTGSNGLLLLGNGYVGTPPGGPWSGAIDPATNVADPVGMGNSDIKTNTGLNIFLVRNYNTAAGIPGGDIDKDTRPGADPANTGDGVIDWKQATPPAGALPPLWADADVIDTIGTIDYLDNDDPVDNSSVPGHRFGYLPSTANINQTWASSTLGQRDPDTFARQLGNDTPNSAASYYGAKLPNTNPTPTDILYRDNRFFGPGNMLGQVTPGRPNLATSLPPTDFRINEVGLNPSGNLSPDDRFQYVEIINTSGQSRSLSGYWLLVIDSLDDSTNTQDDNPGVGTILEEWNLSDFATGSNGLLLLGNGFSPTFTPFQDAVSLQTPGGDPSASNGPPASSGWGNGDLKDNDGLSLLLVKGYSPPSFKDLDNVPQDGVLDTTPWSSISDQIGFTQFGKTTVGRTYSAINLRPVMDALESPDNLSRKLNNLDNSAATGASAWYGGRFPGGASSMNLGFEQTAPAVPTDTFTATWFGGFRGAATPGQPNLAGPIDPAAPPLPGSIRINEVMINPTDDVGTNTDQSNEYVELISTTEAITHMEGMWLLIVDLQGNPGNIVTGSPLSGYSTGLNGLTLLGDGYDRTNAGYADTEGPLPPNTPAFDPDVGFEENTIPNNGVAILLVRGITGPVTLDASGQPTGDLDPENDGTLVAPTDYTTELMDSIAVGPVNPGPGYGWLDSTAFMPDHIARYPQAFAASSSTSWYTGQIPQTAADPATSYVGKFSGNFQGAASPGRANHAAPTGSIAAGAVLFNEIHLNPAGADNNAEFIEIITNPPVARSLNGYTILGIDNTGSNTGTIRQAWSLDGMATGSNGLLLIGNQYPQAASNPWTGLLRAQTGTGDPIGRDGLDSSLSNGTIGGDTDNTGITLLLVRNFTSFIGTDLDQLTAAQAPTDADGIFDAFPWDGGQGGILDSISLRNYAPTVPPPAVVVPPYPYEGWTYGLADITAALFPPPIQKFYNVKTIARFRGELTPNNPAQWYGGDLTGGPLGNTSTAQEYVTTAQNPDTPPLPAGFWGRVTPGQPNLTRDGSADPDADGLPSLVEQAVNADPFSPGTVLLPSPALVTDAGQSFLGITYPRIIGGGPAFPYAAEAYTYLLETSTDLATWVPDPGTGATALVPVGTVTPNPDGVTESATYRLATPLSTPEGRQFIRLKIQRR